VTALRLCLYGPTGSGKSTIARYLVDRHGADLVKVADPLYRLQEHFYRFIGVPVAGQDGELLQFFAHKIERERPGWLGLEVGARVRSATGPLVVNDDCRANAYRALEGLGFVFVRVRTAPAEIRRRSRPDRTPVDPDHPVEQGFEAFRQDYTVDNDGSLTDTLAAVENLLGELFARPPGARR
jgi:hypothetical protein